MTKPTIAEEYEQLFAVAQGAGRDAMLIALQGRNPNNYGACGWAWVTVFPGNSSFARWLKKSKGAHKGSRGGVELYCNECGQSADAGDIYVRAMAQVLRKALPTLEIYGQSRMD